jgi:hypothetical protein
MGMASPFEAKILRRSAMIALSSISGADAKGADGGTGGENVGGADAFASNGGVGAACIAGAGDDAGNAVGAAAAATVVSVVINDRNASS